MGNNKKVNLYRDTASIYDLDQRRITQDVENQIIYPELIYYVTDQDGIKEKIVEPLALLKYYYEEQVRNLLQSLKAIINSIGNARENSIVISIK